MYNYTSRTHFLIKSLHNSLKLSTIVIRYVSFVCKKLVHLRGKTLMNKNSIVTINGQQYDSVSGLPLAGSQSTPSAKRPTPAASIHSSLQKSKTLVRRVTKKPSPITGHRPKVAGKTMDIARSNKIARFAPHPVAPTQPAPVRTRDLPVAAHPIVTKARHSLQSTKPVALPSKGPQAVKEEAIVAALAQPSVKAPRKRFFKRHPRALTIMCISIAIALVGSYLTYVNMPNWSVHVAAASAGVNATYPQYRPDGYSLSGGPQWSDGQVTLNFTANAGTSKFSIKQAKSSWDSSAVLDNVVRKNTGEKYITNQERGLTIYTYSGNAAWVNGGILYTIEGNAPLSGEQIRRIATSL